MEFIGIDIGSSFLKGAVLRLDPPALARIRRLPCPEGIVGLPVGRHELDPAALVAATRQLIGELLSVAPACAGIVICGQMHGLVLVGEDGTARSNAITWRDERAQEAHPEGGRVIEWVEARVGADERARMGNELRPGLPLGALAWLAARGELAAGSCPASLLDFVAAQLCGASPTSEPTNAAAYGLLDLHTGDWHWEVIARLGLGHLRWPEVRPFGAPLGSFTASGRAIPVYAPIGDQQAALLGAALEQGELSLNIATGSQASMLSTHPAPGPYQERPFFDGLLLRTIPRIPAGRALDALLGLLGELAQAQGCQLGDPWGYILREAAAAGDDDGPELSLAFFAGALGERGQIANLHEGNMRVGPLFRAAFQRMARDYAECAEAIDPAGRRRIVFSGGLARRAPLLRELIGRAMPGPQRLSAHPEDTMLGLLALALFAAGHAPSVTAAARLLRPSPEAGESPPAGAA
jgi:sugar (pentulose or hexulose) kinase